MKKTGLIDPIILAVYTTSFPILTHIEPSQCGLGNGLCYGLNCVPPQIHMLRP